PEDCCHTLSIAEPVRLSKAAPASPRQAFHQGLPTVIYARCRAITESEAFQNTIVGVILLNAALAGLMTSQTVQRAAGHDLFWGLDHVIQAVFVVELTLRLLAYGPRLYRFFADGWNLFDLSVVVAAYLPIAGPFATVARLARVLRITRLVTVLPD